MPHSIRFEQLVSAAKGHIREVNVHEARQLQEGGAMLIDVREAEEFQKSHAIGAISLSRGLLELKIEQTVPDPATPIVCYCGGGSRSALAAESLQKMGYTNVASMSGGFNGWKLAELPTE